MADFIKKRSLALIVVLAIILIISIVTTVTALDTSTPNITAYTPAEGSTTDKPGIEVSFTVSDPDLIANSNYYIKVNGIVVASQIKFRGYWEEDTCTGQLYWVTTGYDQATITASATELKDGLQTVEAGAQDRLGNPVVKTWSFNTSVLPVFSNMSPAAGSTASVNNLVFVTVKDNDRVDVSSIKLAVDNPVNLVDYIFDPATGLVTYNVPDPGLSDGLHTMYISAQDMAGNEAVSSWSFTVKGAVQPIIFADAGKTFDSHKPVITAILNSNGKIVEAGTIMKIDGNQVDTVLTYKGHWDYPFELDPVWIVDSYNEATLTYNPQTLSDGPHELAVTLKDALNNTITRTWSFNIAQKPVISGIEPANGSTISIKTPAIKAVIADPNGPAVDQASIKMSVDGTAVVPTIAESDGVVNLSYTPGDLAADTYHEVTLSASDTAGSPNTGTVSWRFYINNKGDMAIDAKACGSCHTLNRYDKYQHDEGPLGVSVKNPSPTHFYSNKCSHCHTGYKDQTCGYCHNGDPMPQYDSNGEWIPSPPEDPAIAAGQDCLYCHSTNNGGWLPSSYSAYHFYWVKNMVNAGLEPIKPLYPDLYFITRHDILPLHKIEKGSCNQCHSTYLTREHNRLNKQGEQMTCATCHSSSNPLVGQAIAAKNRDCSACHTQADHEAVHNSGLDANCRTCHEAVLSAEHLNNSTTAGKNYTCDTCHTSSAKEVRRTIAADSLNCAGCHSEGHNLLFVDKVPADIPLYAGYSWSTPIEASIYISGPEAAAGYVDGQVILSGRKNDVTVQQIWNFYKQELISKGWMLISDPPPAGAAALAAEFSKNGRFVTVKSYNTEIADNTQVVPAGYRIEIWYR